ncbi:MAG TPA: tetratricopeptide repeat protein [Clostridiaceae bacterium]|nr:tetratricopeptide repeat protein [Clostridiaceae bacterium]
MGKVLAYRRDAEINYKVGIKYARKHQYEDAIKFLGTAARKEPFNAEYQFNYACILAELREIKKSNNIFKWILRNIDPTISECYFAIACNYYEMDNLTKTKEYLDKYLQFGCEGEFFEEAKEIIYYFDEVLGISKRNSKSASVLTAEGEELIDKGDYRKARTKLEKAVDAEPRFIAARNGLSIACFHCGQIDRAISIAKSVLMLDSQNIQAICNLALFYACKYDFKSYSKQIKILKELDINSEKDFSADMKQFLKTVLRDTDVEECFKMKIVNVLQLKQIQLLDPKR